MSAAAGGGVTAELLLPPQVLKNLADRSFDKRKQGAQEVERILRRYKEAGNHAAIRNVLRLVAADYACSPLPNNRKGGLIALASAAIGLTSSTADHLDILVPSVLNSFADAENRVRYYACESLFNIAKVCRAAILRYFSDIFIGVCKLVADSDVDVKNGANLLDRLMKEIVLESETVDTATLVPLLRGQMGGQNPYVRQLLVGWITALNDVPGVDLVEHMPQLLDGLFDMLGDGNKEIRQQAYAALAGCMDQLHAVPKDTFGARVAFRPMVETLRQQTRRERDKFNRLTAVDWLTHLMQLGQTQLAPVYSSLLSGVLYCLSDPEGEIVAEAAKANGELTALVRSTPIRDMLPVLPVMVKTVTDDCRSRNRTTRAAALRWVALMLALAPEHVMPGVDDLLAALLANITDSDDPEVMRLNLEVLARLSVYDASFLRRRVLPDLVQLFADNRPLLEAKGAFVLRRLCLLLDARVIYLSLAKILTSTVTGNREFRSLLVEMLNLLLLTTVEAIELRESLRGCCALARRETALAGAAAGGGRSGATAASASSSAAGGAAGGAAGSRAGDAAGAAAASSEGAGDDDEDDAEADAAASAAAAAAAGISSPAAAAAAPADGSGGGGGVVASGSSRPKGGVASASASASGGDPVTAFRRLYKAWLVNPVATFSLCLLTQSYDLGARIVSRFAETTVSVGVLMQADKLVQLLETPVFIHTRMHLTQPERPDHAHLLRSLYGLLMLLPQGTAYATLRDRLSSVTPLHLAIASPYHHFAAAARMAPAAVLAPASVLPPAGSGSGTGGDAAVEYASPVDVDALFTLFAESQRRHKDTVIADLRSRSVLHRYQALQQQQQAAAAAAAAAASTSTSASSTAAAGGRAGGPGASGGAAAVAASALPALIDAGGDDAESPASAGGAAASGGSRSIRDEMRSAAVRSAGGAAAGMPVPAEFPSARHRDDDDDAGDAGGDASAPGTA